MDNQTQDRNIEGERGLPSVNAQKVSVGVVGKLGIVLLVAVAILAVVVVNGGFNSGDKKNKVDPDDRVRNILPPLPEITRPIRPISQPAKPQQPAPPPPVVIKEIKPPAPKLPSLFASKADDTEKRKMGGSLLIFEKSTTTGSNRGHHRQPALNTTLPSSMAPIANAAGGLLGAGQTADGLEANLTPTKLQGAKASLIKDRSFIITRGTFLDCALETAISSDVPGMTSCRLTRNVYSSDGKVLMLDRGSRIIGQYQGGLERGKARIFVLWNRVETPNGVIIDIDSPGTGPLGRAGHTGYIDTHFWERFGGAIMLSLIGDVGNYLVSKANNSSGDTINFGNTTETGQDAAALALEHSIDIPPTLIKNQGDHINVFVARDLDFRGVYDLEVVH